MSAYTRQRHIDHLLQAERETAAILGQLEAALPGAVYQRIAAQVDALPDYEAKHAFLLRADARLAVYREIVDSAERITWNGDGHVTIEGHGQRHEEVPANWEVLRHLAQQAGWNVDEAGSAEDTPASKVTPTIEDQSHDTTDDLDAQIEDITAKIDAASEEHRRTNRAICPQDCNRGQWWADRRRKLEALRQ